MFVVDDRPFVRLHAAQGALLSVLPIAVPVLSSVGNTLLFATLSSGTFFTAGRLRFVLSLVWGLVGLGCPVLWVDLLYSAYTGTRPGLPVAAWQRPSPGGDAHAVPSSSPEWARTHSSPMRERRVR